MDDGRTSQARSFDEQRHEPALFHTHRPTLSRARGLLLLFASLVVPSLMVGSARAMTVTDVRLSFSRLAASHGGDKIRILGSLESPPQSIESFASIRIDIGTFSETIPTSLFRRYTSSVQTGARRYYYLWPANRRKAPAVRSVMLDFDANRIYVRAENLVLDRATNPLPFRVVAGFADQCVMIQFKERPAYANHYDIDPATGQPDYAHPHRVIDARVHSKWTFLEDAPQSLCAIPDIVAYPRGFSVNRPTRVQVSVRVPDSASSHLQIYIVDADLNVVSDSRCELHDDGHNGDDVKSDRVYSCELQFFESDPTTIRLMARGDVNGQEVFSPKIELDVVPELLEEDAAVFLEDLYAARDIWGDKLATLGNTTAAREATTEAIRHLPFIRDVAFNSVAFVIELAVGETAGVRAYLPATGREARSGPIPRGASSDVPIHPNFSPLSFSLYENIGTYKAAVAAGIPEDDRIENTKVLVWAPFFNRFFPNDDLRDLRDRYASSSCPGFDVRVLRDEECTLDSVRAFTRYGTLILASEGTRAPWELIQDRDRLIDKWPLFATGEPIHARDFVYEAANLFVRMAMSKYGVEGMPERRTPRIDVFHDDERGWVWGVRPEFLNELPDRLPESVVYAGWRYSAHSLSQADAFLGSGARTFFGFTQDVAEPFVRQEAQDLFNGMLDSKSAALAYSELPATTDPESGSLLRINGDGRATYAGLFGVLNGGFESGTLTSWGSDGDNRVVSGLGPYAPREGSWMGQISTGLGEIKDRGTLQQTSCVPAGLSHLSFSWNLLSEEFLNFCHRGFNDTFEVAVNGSVVFHRSVDELCDTNLVPVPGLTFDTFDDVYATGWQLASVDISGFLQGGRRSVDLRFGVVDQTDPLYDTVVLLDQVRFE